MRPPHGRWSVADCRLCLLGQALQGASADLQGGSALLLTLPSFFSLCLHSEALPRLLRVSGRFTLLAVLSSPITPRADAAPSAAHHLPFPPPKASISRLTVLALVSRAPRLLITLETLPDLEPPTKGGRREGRPRLTKIWDSGLSLEELGVSVKSQEK